MYDVLRLFYPNTWLMNFVTRIMVVMTLVTKLEEKIVSLRLKGEAGGSDWPILNEIQRGINLGKKNRFHTP